jgi:hypothetical protein
MRGCFWIVSLALLFTNCGTNENRVADERHYTNFRTNYKLSGTRVNIEHEDILGRVFKMWIYDSLLIVYDHSASGGSYFNAFRKSDYKLLASFGRLGHGPGEGAVPGDASLDRKNGRIIQHMQDKFMLYSYAIDSALMLDRRYVPVVEKRSFKDAFIVASETRYYALANFGKEFDKRDNSIIKVIDSKTGEETKKGMRFPTPDYLRPSTNMMFNMGEIVVNEDSGKAVVSYVRWKRLAYIDLNKEQSDTYFLNVPNEPEPIKNDQGKLVDAMLVGYSDISAAGNLLFCTPFSEPVFIEGKYTPNNYPNVVQVFDWQGNPLIELQLDSFVSHFALDLDRKLLIGWDPTSPDPIVEYNLSQVSELN